MNVNDNEKPVDGGTPRWARVMNVEAGPVGQEPPPAIKNPHPVLIGVFIAFFVAIAAMVVAIAVLKPPAG